MSVSYDEFTGAFLNKVTELDFPTDEQVSTEMVDGYMKRAMSQFRHICKYDFITNADDENRVFNVEEEETGDIDEIVDIVSEGMLVQWMKPYLYRNTSYENLLSTRDFTVHSPAELLKAVKSTYNDVDRKFTNMMREYSYNHGELGDLHL